MANKVYIVDGSGYIFRAFYAVQALTNSQGFPTNALYGFIRMIIRLLKAADSEHVIMVFDCGRETFRNELYSQYKANRSECPPELVQQMPYFREISRALGLPIIELPGFEADDVIGTLVERFKREQTEVVIVSGDKDLMQLVNDHVTIWDTMKDKHYGAAEVKEKFGVLPDKVVEVLAIMGDSSDNIPGLRGAGPKTAVQLIERFGDVNSVINNAKAIALDSQIRNRKKIAELIESDPETLRLSRKLVEIDRFSPVMITRDVAGQASAVSPNELGDSELMGLVQRTKFDSELLGNLLEKFEFTSLIKELELTDPGAEKREPANKNYQPILAADFSNWLSRLQNVPEFSFDLETTSLNSLEAQIVGASFCWSGTEAFYLPLGHKTVAGQIAIEDFLNLVGPILVNPNVGKLGQNIKYDMQVLVNYDLDLQGIIFDSMIASYLINPDKSSHNLTELAKEFLALDVIEFDEVVGDKADFSYVELMPATNYACQDAHYVWLLREKLNALLIQNDLVKLFLEVELPLVPVLAQMERKGVKLDTQLLGELSAEFGAELDKLKLEIYSQAGTEFNINSPKQLADILFNKLGISTKGLKKTKSGISTDSSVLEKLAASHSLPTLLLRYRMLNKLKTTYVDVLPQMCSAKTGRLHSRFNQTITGTGRLSSSDPNLQNIPIQTAEGRRIREAFVADKDKVLISADYSQIELRLLAHMSADTNLISSFAEDLDVHAKTAREIMGIGVDEEVTSDVRRIGKTINFGIIYGMGGFRLARELGIPVATANSYIENYFARYPQVKNFFARLESDAAQKGFVTTLLGRKRFISTIDSSGRDSGFVVRAAINAPLQGTAADIIKLAMIAVHRRFQAEKSPVDLVLQIHDELVFECDKNFLVKAKEMITTEMESVLRLDVPLKVEIGSGFNWQEAHA